MASICNVLHLSQRQKVGECGRVCGIGLCPIDFLLDDFWSLIFALLITLEDLCCIC